MTTTTNQPDINSLYDKYAFLIAVLTSFIPGFIVINIILGVFNFRNQRAAILRGSFFAVILFLAIYALFWILYVVVA